LTDRFQKDVSSVYEKKEAPSTNVQKKLRVQIQKQTGKIQTLQSEKTKIQQENGENKKLLLEHESKSTSQAKKQKQDGDGDTEREGGVRVFEKEGGQHQTQKR